jgi:hypothetical protein
MPGTKTAAASASAVLSALATLACCMPMSFAAAAGLAGVGMSLSRYRPWLLGASVVMLAVGFIQHYRAPQCDRNRARWSSAILWAAAAIVLTNLIFPQWIAGLMAGPAR